MAPRDLGGAANDLWLAGDDGLAHYDGTTWARVVGAGAPQLAFVETVGTDVWLAGASGVYRVRSKGVHEAKARPLAKARVTQAVTVIDPPTVAIPWNEQRLRVAGRADVDGAHEVVASAVNHLWIRDHHGVVDYDGQHARVVTPRLSPWLCRHCLAPTDAAHGYVLGARLHAIGLPQPSPQRLTHMLGIVTVPSARPRIVGGADHAEEPSALWLDSGAFGWEIPTGCFANVAVRGDDTWLVGGERCDHHDTSPWPAGEGMLVHRTARGVAIFRAPDGPLLDMVGTNDGEAWAVGVGGTILHVSAGGLERFQVNGLPRLHAIATHDGTVWIAGDDSTVLRLTTLRGTALGSAASFERIAVAPLPPRSVILSLAFRNQELWLASPDGLFMTAE